MKSDSTIEKPLLYLFVFSLLLHIGVFALVLYLPEPKQPPMEPVFIDLQQMPELKSVKPDQKQAVKRHSDQQVRVQKETAPRGTDAVNKGSKPNARPAQKPVTPNVTAPGSSIQSLLKSKSQIAKEQNRPQLFPGAGKMAQLEEVYRRKFEKDIEQGDTRFLNSNDVLFGSFLRRFENAVYGVWQYPQEAAIKGIEGITPVKITFNRRGEIIHVRLLESSGAIILDDEVLRTLKRLGPVGSFPKGYEKDEFNLIAFFSMAVHPGDL